MKLIKTRLIMFCALLAISGLFFGNCTQVNISGSDVEAAKTDSDEVTKNSGGGAYDGKPYTHRDYLKCGFKTPESIINHDAENGAFWLVQEGCLEISPKMLNPISVKFITADKTKLEYKEKVFADESVHPPAKIAESVFSLPTIDITDPAQPFISDLGTRVSRLDEAAAEFCKIAGYEQFETISIIGFTGTIAMFNFGGVAGWNANNNGGTLEELRCFSEDTDP